MNESKAVTLNDGSITLPKGLTRPELKQLLQGLADDTDTLHNRLTVEPKSSSEQTTANSDTVTKPDTTNAEWTITVELCDGRLVYHPDGSRRNKILKNVVRLNVDKLSYIMPDAIVDYLSGKDSQ